MYFKNDPTIDLHHYPFTDNYYEHSDMSTVSLDFPNDTEQLEFLDEDISYPHSVKWLSVREWYEKILIGTPITDQISPMIKIILTSFTLHTLKLFFFPKNYDEPCMKKTCSEIKNIISQETDIFPRTFSSILHTLSAGLITITSSTAMDG